MDLVDGPPLSRVISELRFTISDFRRIARWMNPSDVKLNLVIEGKGTVWIDDVRLLAGPR